ncbi:MAG TPA: hypothetical protein VFT67_08215 [Jatrophihabitantaceae bacterium]|nr:hypothetical protein [Jatrophihabitantaceae bacterium]
MIDNAQKPGRPGRSRTFGGLRRARVLLPVAIITAAAGGVAMAAAATAAPPPHNGKVTLCHARPPASAKNGWVQITVSTNAVTHEGHGKHADDIIPSFTYYVKSAQHTYPGKNLSTMFGGFTGAQILANGCALPAAAAPTPATTTPAAVVTKTVAAPAPGHVVVTTVAPAPVTSTRTIVRHVPGAVTTHTITSSASASKVRLVAVQNESAGVDAVQATASPSTTPLAESIGVASGATGDGGSGFSDHIAIYAAIGGAALAALLGMGGVAFWRRHNGARL